MIKKIDEILDEIKKQFEENGYADIEFTDAKLKLQDKAGNVLRFNLSKFFEK